MAKVANPRVAAVLATYPPKMRRKVMALRKLILDTARATEGVGELEETLKWGEPSYLPSATKSGSTVRIAWKKSAPKQYGMYFHCQTQLVPAFRAQFPETFRFEGNRGIVFGEDDRMPVRELAACVEMALTYHRIKGTLRA